MFDEPDVAEAEVRAKVSRGHAVGVSASLAAIGRIHRRGLVEVQMSPLSVGGKARQAERPGKGIVAIHRMAVGLEPGRSQLKWPDGCPENRPGGVGELLNVLGDDGIGLGR